MAPDTNADVYEISKCSISGFICWASYDLTFGFPNGPLDCFISPNFCPNLLCNS